MRGYIVWLSKQVEKLPQMLHDAFIRSRAEALERTKGQHGRTAEAIAHMMVGYECMLYYLRDVGALTDDEARKAYTHAWGVVTDNSARQAAEMKEDRPSKIFLSTISELLIAKSVACRRFLRDLERSKDPAYPWRFDEEKAARPCNFIERFLSPTKGDYDRMELMPWQCFVECNLYGWVDKETGLRRYREGLIVVGTGNGKSTMLALFNAFGGKDAAGFQEYGRNVCAAIAKGISENSENTDAVRDAISGVANAAYYEAVFELTAGITGSSGAVNSAVRAVADGALAAAAGIMTEDAGTTLGSDWAGGIQNGVGAQRGKLASAVTQTLRGAAQAARTQFSASTGGPIGRAFAQAIQPGARDGDAFGRCAFWLPRNRRRGCRHPAGGGVHPVAPGREALEAGRVRLFGRIRVQV